MATRSRTLQITKPLLHNLTASLRAVRDVKHKTAFSDLKKKKKRNLCFWRFSSSHKLPESCVIPLHHPLLILSNWHSYLVAWHLISFSQGFIDSKWFYHLHQKISFFVSLLYCFMSKQLWKRHVRLKAWFPSPEYPSKHHCYWLVCTEEEEKRERQGEKEEKRNKWKRTRGEVAPRRWTGSVGRGDWEGIIEKKKKKNKRTNKKKLVKTHTHWKRVNFI